MKKKFFLLVSLICLAISTLAQPSQIKTANNSLAKLHVSITEKADAKKQLTIIGEGIKAVEAAEKDRRTRKWPETWAIKAYLCSYVALIDENTSNADKYFQAAVEALKKAIRLDKFQSNGTLLRAADYNIHIKMQREGSMAFQQNDFSNAYQLLKKVSDFLPTDTALATNVALCAQNLQQYNEALSYFTRAQENGAKNPVIFQHIANIYASKFDNEQAIKSLEKGLELNPNYVFLIHDYINLLLDTEHYDKATKAIETLLSIDDENKVLYFLDGYLQQNHLKNIANAEKSYKEALKIDPHHFTALYQLAMVYLQHANDALENKAVKEFNAYINRAEFLLLKAHDVNINHRKTIRLLIEIYTRKNRLDKVQELKRKLNEF